MEIIIDKGCGLDVHKETVVACVMGSGIKKEIRTYSTMTGELYKMKEWLKGLGVTHVAMESTGVYWKPIFNILEDSFEVILVNARHIKNVPGRKTDVKDCEWICKLLRSGLVNGSFIPPRDIRELRDLTRYRRKLIEAISAEKNRVQKVLEDANIKLSSVVTDSFGTSGSEIIEELMRGELTIDQMAGLARGKLIKKKEKLKQALQGYFTAHHKFMIQVSLNHISAIEQQIAALDAAIDEKLKKHEKEYQLLQTIPGVKEHGASSIIGEIGTEMDKFASEDHLSSWAGISPGNNESAGKKRSGHTTHGDTFLKSILVECAWAAVRTKNTYLKGKYHSLAGRRGKKRALIAVGHKILIMCYHIIKYKQSYKELGADYLIQQRKQQIVRSHVRMLKKLGYTVDIKQPAAA
ncbi:MAG: IS110 family transposase [Deltaproteobacteria bacterium]|nr:IS110 family transposase [Deltaproteobacteria bacterium]MCL5276281.1 IS110 family transposase [Deltaproteobacteria bacterium]